MDKQQSKNLESPFGAADCSQFHWLWIIPLAAFCSPLGILFWLKVAPEFWWISAGGIMLCLSATCMENVERNPDKECIDG